MTASTRKEELLTAVRAQVSRSIRELGGVSEQLRAAGEAARILYAGQVLGNLLLYQGEREAAEMEQMGITVPELGDAVMSGVRDACGLLH